VKTRKFLNRFQPYEWETPTSEIASRVGIRPERVHRLDTNTSPFIPVSSLKALAPKLHKMAVNQYPDTSYLGIRRLLSTYCKVGDDRFVITNGADEGLDILAKTFLDPGDEAVVVSPSYSMFRIITEVMDGKLISLPRTQNFDVDVESLLRAVRTKTRVIFLCNPNNPTGNRMPLDDIASLAERTEATIAIDEAYFEYSGESAVRLTEKHANIVVIRTFSKAFSMAGVRVGYLVAAKETINQLNKVRPPNSLTVLSLALAEEALKNQGEMRRNVRKIVSERRRCFEALRKVGGVEPHPSEANFVLFKVKDGDANRVQQRLMKRGFVLRNLADVPQIENSLRVTISTPEVNDGFLSALKSTLLS
jgi:histidinol-phosphate aminotransferase